MGSPDQAGQPIPDHETSTVATLQSLIIAFVLAMTFRGFITEGFVIPTGSMAPTLLGEHLLIHSNQTGYTFPVDAKGSNLAGAAVDPMLGPEFPLPTYLMSRVPLMAVPSSVENWARRMCPLPGNESLALNGSVAVPTTSISGSEFNPVANISLTKKFREKLFTFF